MLWYSSGVSKPPPHHVVIVLDNIRSVLNVGSIFRTANALHIQRVVLAGYTPTPTDRFGRARKDFEKTALGAQKTISWSHVATTAEAVRKLQAEGFMVVAVEQHETSVTYTKFKAPQKVAFVFGNETEGVAVPVLSLCDGVVDIPMFGEKESLNVAVAAGVVLYGVLVTTNCQ